MKRRKFIQNTSTALSASLLASKTGFSLSNSQSMNKITNIKPLGFVWETQDPFLFCVHHLDFYPRGEEHMGPAQQELEGRNIGQDFNTQNRWRMYHGDTIPGFPAHPHRGFETVTVVRQGVIDHTDSLGAAGRYGDGDIQWMTAGKGIQHAEMFPLINSNKNNTLELFQIWLNLPKSKKMVEPYFKMLWNEIVPKIQHADNNGNKTVIEVIAGTVNGKIPSSPPPDSWAFDTTNEVAIWNIIMDANSTWQLPHASAGVNRTLYFYEGENLEIDDIKLKSYHSAQLNPEEPLELKIGQGGAKILILQGKPINETVVQHGPFVMNSKEEIKETFEEYRRSEFGGWPWNENDPVHPKTKGRFAKHADGTIEEK